MTSRLLPPSLNQGTAHSTCAIPGRLAYIVNHSYPYSSNGYAVRTHGIAKALVGHGHSVLVVNRPGRPWDIPGFSDNGSPSHKNIDGVRYLFLREPSIKAMPWQEYQEAATEALKEVLGVFKPAVVMAASNWENGLPARDAARALGLPFFYEVRGFWEISRISRDPEWEKSAAFARAVAMETQVAQSAERVFTLNRFMKEELVRRGVDGAKIDLVSNGYGELPDLSKPPKLTRKDLGITSRFVVGYVGSFNAYEGLEDLIRACAEVRKQGVDLSLLLVGSSNPSGIVEHNKGCRASQTFRDLANALDFGRWLHLSGRVQPDLLTDCYALMDLVVIPRKRMAVCELVSPIKPLEAAAQGKAILVSDVGPLREMLEEAGTGCTFKAGHVENLAERIRELLTNEKLCRELGHRHRQWVGHSRSWQKAIERILCTEPLQRGQLLFDGSPALLGRKHSHDPGHCTKPGTVYGLAQKDPPFLPEKPFEVEIAVDKYNQIIPLPFETPARKEKRRLQVASILDPFSHACFAPECDLIPITPEHWREELFGRDIDMVFVESAWHGNNDSWACRVAKYNAPAGRELMDVIQWARKSSMPTVFWNKEDPSNFDRFVEQAIEFDYIFTTDENCIDRYRKHAQRDITISALPFAAQPRIHNPHLEEPRVGATFFAGTYYADDFAPRRKAMELLLKTAARYGLDIFDRMHHAKGKDKERYLFPEDLQKHIVGSLEYGEMLKAYRRYRVGLNVNSVSDSPTMFSRRVFEMLACATPVVSTPSCGIDRFFSGIVATVASEHEASHALDLLVNNPMEWLKISVLGLREVFSKHTYAHRLLEIARILNIDAQVSPEPDLVVVVYPHDDTQTFCACLANQNIKPSTVLIAGLRYRDRAVGRYLEQVCALGLKAMAIPRENIPIYIKDRHPHSVVAIWDSRYHYGPSYLLDAWISVRGEPQVMASTIHPGKDASAHLKNLRFEDVKGLGMDAASAFSGSLVVRADCERLADCILHDADGYFPAPFPLKTRPWVDFFPMAHAHETGKPQILNITKETHE